MAKRGDSIFGDVKGKAGDYIFKTVKKKKILVKAGEKKNNHTKPRQRSEQLFESLPKIWSSLKRWEKRTWEALLKTEVTFKNSKYGKITDSMSLFISCNRNLQEAEESFIRIAPQMPVFPEQIIGIKFDVIIGTKEEDIIMHLPSTINKDTKLIFYATPVITSASDKINERLYRKIGVRDSKCKTKSSIYNDYIKVFKKMPEEGDEISIRYRAINKQLGTSSLPLHHIIMVKNQINKKKEAARKR